MFAFTQIFVFATIALSLVIPRDASQILTDLQNIKAAYDKLTAADNNFSSGADPDPGHVQDAVDQVEITNVFAISDTNLTTPLSESDVTNLVNYVNDSLEPAIVSEIKAAEGGKSLTDKQGISIAVAIEMQELKSFSDAIGNNLVAKAPSKTAVAKIKAAFGKIDSDYRQGIAFFSS